MSRAIPGLALADKYDLGEALHTALRKCCDSNPTSIVYNIVHLMPKTEWEKFLDQVWGIMADQGEMPSVPEALRDASIVATSWDTSAMENNAWRAILHCAFEMFEEGDWGGFASFLVEDE